MGRRATFVASGRAAPYHKDRRQGTRVRAFDINGRYWPDPVGGIWRDELGQWWREYDQRRADGYTGYRERHPGIPFAIAPPEQVADGERWAEARRVHDEARDEGRAIMERQRPSRVIPAEVATAFHETVKRAEAAYDEAWEATGG